MQKPIDTTQRINQLLLRASKLLNTLGERKGVHEGNEGGGREGVSRRVRRREGECGGKEGRHREIDGGRAGKL